MAKNVTLQPEETVARDYADRLILEALTELGEAIKPAEICERLQSGLSLAVVRSFLASNPTRFAYNERRWVPAAKVAGVARPLAEQLRIAVERFNSPVPLNLLATELADSTNTSIDEAEEQIRRIVHSDPWMFITRDARICPSSIAFVAHDESLERALALNGVEESEIEEVEKKLGKFDWRQKDAILLALEKAAPVSTKALAATAWKSLNVVTWDKPLIFEWKSFHAELFSVPGFVYGGDGTMWPEDEVKKWLASANKIASKVVAVIEVEDAAPLELKKEDVENLIKSITGSDDSVTATHLLESVFEITPAVKTYPDDMANVMQALNSDKRVWWVGGDRFRKPGTAPDYITLVPEPFNFVTTAFTQEDGDPVDIELNDEGLSSSLRKLLSHPLATDVNDEDVMPEPRNMPESMRLVLKPIHRELGTFPLSQFPTGWFDAKPEVQELVLIDESGKEIQCWLNNKSRLIFGLFDWWLDQPVESGAVFSLTKTEQPNVLTFQWLDQTDPVVYISNQRIEELREIATRAEELSTFDILREVMAHWPKGADYLTLLWEVNVVRRTSRRMLASILSSYVCFYQRSGSPVWHFDHKKVEQGFDKTKKKFILKD